MKRPFYQILIVLCTVLIAVTSAVSSEKKPMGTDTVDTVLDKIEARYQGKLFSADFFQESPLPDLGIIEEAKGKVYFGKEERFRWEYAFPEILHYISDGETLWIHGPADNNVWIGKTAAFFGKGSSAGFLTDIRSLRKRFHSELKSSGDLKMSTLLMVPKKGDSSFGINRLTLTVEKETGLIIRIVTENINEEETRIFLKNQNFADALPETLFKFSVPDNANVIPME